MKSKLSTLCDYIKEKVAVETLTSKNYVSTENMLPNKRGILPSTSLPSVKYVQKYLSGDILISNIRPYFKKIWQANFDGGCSNDVLVIRAKNKCDPVFLYYVLSNDTFFDYATVTSKGTKMPRGDKDSIMQYEVPTLDIEKQYSIGRFLKNLDDKIKINERINDNLVA